VITDSGDRDHAVTRPIGALGARRAYLDGELCGMFPDGITSSSMIQAASDAGNAAGLVFFIFDLLHLDGDDVGARPLIERKARLTELLSGAAPPLHYRDYHRGRGPAFHEQACKLELESRLLEEGPIRHRAVVEGLDVRLARTTRRGIKEDKVVIESLLGERDRYQGASPILPAVSPGHLVFCQQPTNDCSCCIPHNHRIIDILWCRLVSSSCSLLGACPSNVCKDAILKFYCPI
jgi:hypothetical protein